MMKFHWKLLTISAFFLVSLPAVAAPTAKPSQPGVEKRVAELLKKMTLEEKVGQMTQVTLDVVSKKRKGKPQELDEAKLQEVLLKNHVGSILNVGTSDEVDNSAYPLDHWHQLIQRVQDVAMKSRLKIPVIYGIDSIHGAQFTRGATIFPQSLALAATWNPELSRKSGEVTALETRASGIPWNFFPVLDVGRQPLWSRLFETYGEDPFLAAAMGRANVEGQQGRNLSDSTHVAACLKHYVGYSFPWSGKDRTPAIITEQMMQEIFLPSFKAAIDAGAETVMINSGEVNGIPGHANHHLLTEVLRKQLGFKGFTVSDWEDIKRLHTRDHVASSPEEAVRMAVMAGVDMSMVPNDLSFSEILIKLAREKKVPMSRIDEAVSRILRVKFLLGLFESPYPDATLKARFGTEESRLLSRQAAAESITLLKNEGGVLPLSKKARVLVTGPTAHSLSAMNGGWTYTWQGDREDVYPKDGKTLLKALQEKLGMDHVTYYQGTTLNQKAPDFEKAVHAAKKADAVILCLGEKASTETQGNIDDLNLDHAQLLLAREVAKSGKPVVLVLFEGRPRIIRAIEPGIPAIVMGYHPGMEGAMPMADILFGDVNPSGKLPISYPRGANSLITYDHKYQEEKEGNVYDPQWPFGHGLSYTSFEYSDLEVKPAKIRSGQPVQVSVRVKNTGARSGKEVVQLYLSQLYRAEVSPPVRQLKGFSKVELAPGESRRVEFQITPEHYSFHGQNGKLKVEPGKFKVGIAKLEREFELSVAR